MAEELLRDRSNELDEAFYPRQAGALREQLRLREGERTAVEALGEASDVTDEAILRKLAGLGIRVETLAALTMIPIVEVAWADGIMEDKERSAILWGAESIGIAPESPSYGLLQLWTDDRPAPDLYEAWKAFVSALQAELSPEERDRLCERLVSRTRAVAEAAGGFLGVGAVSSEERAVLDRLERTLLDS